VAVAGKPDDNSCFLLLLPRAEAQAGCYLFFNGAATGEEDGELKNDDPSVLVCLYSPPLF
jgi:hypothetical protein